ncbi:hypothetical protein TUM19329_17520 [Legionella antarctica]|uniref:Transmembrane protein n=1 Tax=Legionella antarctica TaxID=2708020 RepID=A0A6F8T4K0_9GAMM|nr:hypothetical protein [Legionella antarctica]BCA95391.1 hypothetical protein TUM19329_17520 [Legionella antarctica]
MIKILDEIEGLVSGKLSSLKTILSIFKLEARLAGLSVYPLMLNLCLIFVVLITIWLSGMLLIGYFAALFWGTFLLAVCLILTLNIILFVGLLSYLSYNLNNMSFEKTRASLSSKEYNENGKLKKKINRRNNSAGKDIARPEKPNNDA